MEWIQHMHVHTNILVLLLFTFTNAGCVYSGRSYSSGDRVEMDDPCLKCACHRRQLTCNLQVCPTLPRNLHSSCRVQKNLGDCCAKLSCESSHRALDAGFVQSSSSQTGRNNDDLEGENEPWPSTPKVTSSEEDNSLRHHAVKGGSSCRVNGTVFADGSALPSGSHCNYCYCLKGEKQCIQPQCHLNIKGCHPQYLDNFSCCPTHYNCTELALASIRTTTTTISSTDGSNDTIATDIHNTEQVCNVDGNTYQEGARVPSGDICNNCFCVRGNLKCTLMKCSQAIPGCSPILQPNHCCPVSYDCSTNETSFNSSIIAEETDETSKIRENDRIMQFPYHFLRDRFKPLVYLPHNNEHNLQGKLTNSTNSTSTPATVVEILDDLQMEGSETEVNIMRPSSSQVDFNAENKSESPKRVRSADSKFFELYKPRGPSRLTKLFPPRRTSKKPSLTSTTTTTTPISTTLEVTSDFSVAPESETDEYAIAENPSSTFLPNNFTSLTLNTGFASLQTSTSVSISELLSPRTSMIPETSTIEGTEAPVSHEEITDTISTIASSAESESLVTEKSFDVSLPTTSSVSTPETTSSTVTVSLGVTVLNETTETNLLSTERKIDSILKKTTKFSTENQNEEQREKEVNVTESFSVNKELIHKSTTVPTKASTDLSTSKTTLPTTFLETDPPVSMTTNLFISNSSIPIDVSNSISSTVFTIINSSPKSISTLAAKKESSQTVSTTESESELPLTIPTFSYIPLELLHPMMGGAEGEFWDHLLHLKKQTITTAVPSNSSNSSDYTSTITTENTSSSLNTVVTDTLTSGHTENKENMKISPITIKMNLEGGTEKSIITNNKNNIKSSISPNENKTFSAHKTTTEPKRDMDITEIPIKSTNEPVLSSSPNFLNDQQNLSKIILNELNSVNHSSYGRRIINSKVTNDSLINTTSTSFNRSANHTPTGKPKQTNRTITFIPKTKKTNIFDTTVLHSSTVPTKTSSVFKGRHSHISSYYLQKAVRSRLPNVDSTLHSNINSNKEALNVNTNQNSEIPAKDDNPVEAYTEVHTENMDATSVGMETLHALYGHEPVHHEDEMHREVIADPESDGVYDYFKEISHVEEFHHDLGKISEHDLTTMTIPPDTTSSSKIYDDSATQTSPLIITGYDNKFPLFDKGTTNTMDEATTKLTPTGQLSPQLNEKLTGTIFVQKLGLNVQVGTASSPLRISNHSNNDNAFVLHENATNHPASITDHHKGIVNTTRSLINSRGSTRLLTNNPEIPKHMLIESNRQTNLPEINLNVNSTRTKVSNGNVSDNHQAVKVIPFLPEDALTNEERNVPKPNPSGASANRTITEINGRNSGSNSTLTSSIGARRKYNVLNRNYLYFRPNNSRFNFHRKESNFTQYSGNQSSSFRISSQLDFSRNSPKQKTDEIKPQIASPWIPIRSTGMPEAHSERGNSSMQMNVNGIALRHPFNGSKTSNAHPSGLLDLLTPNLTEQNAKLDINEDINPSVYGPEENETETTASSPLMGLLSLFGFSGLGGAQQENKSTSLKSPIDNLQNQKASEENQKNLPHPNLQSDWMPLKMNSDDERSNSKTSTSPNSFGDVIIVTEMSHPLHLPVIEMLNLKEHPLKRPESETNESNKSESMHLIGRPNESKTKYEDVTAKNTGTLPVHGENQTPTINNLGYVSHSTILAEMGQVKTDLGPQFTGKPKIERIQPHLILRNSTNHSHGRDPQKTSNDKGKMPLIPYHTDTAVGLDHANADKSSFREDEIFPSILSTSTLSISTTETSEQRNNDDDDFISTTAYDYDQSQSSDLFSGVTENLVEQTYSFKQNNKNQSNIISTQSPNFPDNDQNPKPVKDYNVINSETTGDPGPEISLGDILSLFGFGSQTQPTHTMNPIPNNSNNPVPPFIKPVIQTDENLHHQLPPKELVEGAFPPPTTLHRPPETNSRAPWQNYYVPPRVPIPEVPAGMLYPQVPPDLPTIPLQSIPVNEPKVFDAKPFHETITEVSLSFSTSVNSQTIANFNNHKTESTDKPLIEDSPPPFPLYHKPVHKENKNNHRNTNHREENYSDLAMQLLPLNNIPKGSEPSLSSHGGFNPFIFKVEGCDIYGKYHNIGEKVKELSNVCKECTCTEFGVQCHQSC